MKGIWFYIFRLIEDNQNISLRRSYLDALGNANVMESLPISVHLVYQSLVFGNEFFDLLLSLQLPPLLNF